MDNTEDFFKNYRGKYSQYWIERWGLIPELPTSFDNANSMYELVAWLQRAFKNLLDDFQQLEAESEDFKNAIIGLLEYLIPELIRRYHDSAEFRTAFIILLEDILAGEERTWVKDLLKELLEVDMREWIEDYLKTLYGLKLNELENQLVQKPYQYNTLADMKSDNLLTSGMSAITLGYASPNDGGGGTYKIQSISTKQANNGNVIALNNGNFAILQTEPCMYRIEQWGGIPSQLCDTALKNIIKDAKENNKGFTIIFGYGTYNFEDNHVFDKRIMIEGKGVENTTLNFIGVDTDKPFITIGSDTRIASVSIRDIRLKGNNKYKTGLKLVKTSAKTELTNVRIVEFKKEGLLAMGVYDATVNNLEISDCGGLLEGNYYYGLTMTNIGNDNSNAWHIVNSRFERSPYMIKAFKTFSMQMTNCKFEAGDAVSINDGNQPYILVDSPAYAFIFNSCSFVATSVERIRSLKGDNAFIPYHMVEVKNTSVNAPVSLTGCEFLSATQGALFIKGSRVIISACTFNLVNGQMGNLYSIDLSGNSILSNSRVHVYQSQEGGLIPIFSNNGIVKNNVISMWTRSGITIVGQNSAVAIPLGTPSNRIDNLTTQHALQFTEV